MRPIPGMKCSVQFYSHNGPEWRDGYEVLQIVSADDRSYRIIVIRRNGAGVRDYQTFYDCAPECVHVTSE